MQKYKYSVPYFFDTWFAFYNTICDFIFVGVCCRQSHESQPQHTMIKTVEVKMEPNFMKFTKMLMHYITKYFLGFLIVFLSSILVAFVASRSIEDYIIEKRGR